MSIEKKVWETLSTIDVSHLIEKKGGLDYLPWSDAWCILMNNFPKSYYREEYEVMADGSVMVKVTVTIWDGEEMAQRHIFLPVMDHRNNAIKNPTSRQLSDSYMRALVKCLAMFGLGLNLYTGDSAPVNQEQASESEKELIRELIRETESDVLKFQKVFGEVDSISSTHAQKAIEILKAKRDRNENP